MSTDSLQKVFENLGCLPHQVEFATKFLAAESAEKHLLVSSPGLGKGFTASAIAGYTATQGQATRALVLAPPVVIAQWSDTIRRIAPDVPCMIVDRRRLRELEAAQSNGDTLWPAHGILLMSTGFSRQVDVAEKLAQTSWDLLVVDEAQLLRPNTLGWRLVAQLHEKFSNMRVLFLRVDALTTSDGHDYSADPLLCDAAITVWSRDTVRDEDGNPLLPEIKIEWIRHHRREEEIQVLSQLQKLLKRINRTEPRFRLEATMLLQRASSSLFALEQSLNRMQQQRNRIAHGTGQRELFEEEFEDEEPAEVASLMHSEFVDETSTLLEMIDEVDVDSKCEALVSLLDKIGVLTSSDRRVCVFTSFVDTATYLHSALGEVHPSVTVTTGNLTRTERQHAIQDFEQKGGILVTTAAMSTALPEVAAVIFYDIPLNPATIDARLGQFIRVGRSATVDIFAFTDESNALAVERLQRKATHSQKAISQDQLQKELFSEDEINMNEN